MAIIMGVLVCAGIVGAIITVKAWLDCNCWWPVTVGAAGALVKAGIFCKYIES